MTSAAGRPDDLATEPLEQLGDGLDETAARGVDPLRLATAQLRGRPDQRSVEIADAVLRRSLSAPRRAQLVRATAPHGHVRVSTTVLTAALREGVDSTLDGAAVGRIVFDVSRDEELLATTVELVVRFGTDILDVADRARATTRVLLADLLGDPDPHVVVQHVHVNDVTVGDPHLLHPADE